MTRPALILLFALLHFCSPGFAENTHGADASMDQNMQVAAFLKELSSSNSIYMDGHKIEFFAGLSKGQSPIATIVTCSDSRVQTNMFSRSPEGQLFMIRNIGNQLGTAEGSVEYGVHHLHSPVLMFLGHSRCGAIAAASGNYSKESEAIRRELDTISIPKEVNNTDGVKTNVHNQVRAAMVKFAEEVGSGHLTVIGAVMDFADDLHRGSGKLHIINVNGEADPARMDDIASLLANQRPARKAATEKRAH